ncbi:MAG: UDP-3-O-acyl-N-acetylglucosamine deacetylase, partial [Gemmatimonadales bacterium]
DNVMIELDGEEPPAGDGSSARFVALIKEAGIEEQGTEATVWNCETPFSVSEGSSRYTVSPGVGFVISGSIEFDHPCIGRQHRWCDVRPDSFADEIGLARTFGFLDDAAALRAAGMARGADMTNTIVLTADGLYDGVELRYEDEFVRHKILDIVGDLALVGRRITAHIVAERPGHRGNIALARGIALRANHVEKGQ